MEEVEEQNPGRQMCENCREGIFYGNYGSQIKSSNGKYYHRFCHPNYRPKTVTFECNQHTLDLNLSKQKSKEYCEACKDEIYMEASRYTYKHKDKKLEYSVHPDCAINLVPSDVVVFDVDQGVKQAINMKVRLQAASGGKGCEMCPVDSKSWTYVITLNDGIEHRYHLKCVRDDLNSPANTQNFVEQRGPNWQTELCKSVLSFLAKSAVAAPFPINLIAIGGAPAVVAAVKIIADTKAAKRREVQQRASSSSRGPPSSSTRRR